MGSDESMVVKRAVLNAAIAAEKANRKKINANAALEMNRTQGK
jgi:hypothetical protein